MYLVCLKVYSCVVVIMLVFVLNKICECLVWEFLFSLCLLVNNESIFCDGFIVFWFLERFFFVYKMEIVCILLLKFIGSSNVYEVSKYF